MKIFSYNLLFYTITTFTISIISGSLGWINQYIIVGLIYLIIPVLLFKKEDDYNLNILKGIILIIPFISIYGITAVFKDKYYILPIILISIISLTFSLFILNGRHKKNKILLTIILIILTG